MHVILSGAQHNGWQDFTFSVILHDIWNLFVADAIKIKSLLRSHQAQVILLIAIGMRYPQQNQNALVVYDESW